MTQPLPHHIQPLRLAERGAIFAGELPFSSLPRLHDLLTHTSGVVHVELQFGKDKSLIPYLTGTLKACLPLECQRCLKTIDYSLTLEVSLSPVFDEATGNRLPNYYEPLLLQEDHVLLAELIEEELLLGLPAVPKHEYACQTSPSA